MTSISSFSPEGHPPLAPTYSHISSISIGPNTKLIQISGQVGLDPTNIASNPDFLAQVHHAFANLDKCLKAVGAKKSDIMHTRQFIVKMGSLSKHDFGERGRIYLDWLRSTTNGVTGIGDGVLSPAETLVGVDSQTDGCFFEVEALVVINTGEL